MSKINLLQYTTIIFDCDGVIFDSNQLKSDAMYSVLLKYDIDSANQFRPFFNKNFGRSRSFFIESFIKDYYKVPFTKVLFDEIEFYYAQQCFELYKTAEFTLGFYDFLNQMYDKKNLYIASGSNQSELKDIFKLRELDSFFCQIWGSPKNKSLILKDVLDREKGKCLFIGDSEHDFNCSKENNIDFLLLKNYSITQKSILDYIESQCEYAIDSFMELVTDYD